MLLEPGEDGSGILDFGHEVDGSGASFLNMPAGGSLRPATHETVDKKLHYVKQEGASVFKYAVRKFAESAEGLLLRNDFTSTDVDLFVAHQANIRIIRAACERLEIPQERTAIVLDRTGNTSSASIPLALIDAIEQGRLRTGDLVLLSGFGAGMTWGSALLRWGDPDEYNLGVRGG